MDAMPRARMPSLSAGSAPASSSPRPREKSHAKKCPLVLASRGPRALVCCAGKGSGALPATTM
eukprot:3431828-Pyramimonas_sp.AAC.1